jgi:hypothetical protein
MTETIPISDQRRTHLPHRRMAETFELRHGNLNTVFYVTLGRYPDGQVGEVFVSGAKAGSELEAMVRDGAILLSLAMQHHVPLDLIRRAVTREQNGVASTIIGTVLDKLAEGE